ncbi:MAG: zinc dependent phospholipase C family protein [Myxococcota bacterium]
MPAPTVHLTFAEMLADAPEVPRAVRSAVRSSLPYARLGGIYHDLPYYTGVAHLCVGYWRENAAEICPWGVRLHRDAPGAFAEHLVRTLRTADGPLDRSERLAFLAGFLSHALLDHTLHPLVNHAAERQQSLCGGEVSHHHRLVEKFHSIFFHAERFGEDVLGSSVMRERARLGASWRVERPLAEFMTGLLRGRFGEAPSPGRWASWVRCYQRISFLLSTPLAALGSRRSRTERAYRLYYANPEHDFREFFAAAETRTHRFISFAHDYFEAGDFSNGARARFIEEAALDDLAFPDRVAHPVRRISELRDTVSGRPMGRAVSSRPTGRAASAYPAG